MTPEEVVAKVFGVPVSEITETTSNRTLPAWDSLGHMVLVVELESTYGISFSADDTLRMSDLKTIKDILRTQGAVW